MEVVEAAGEPDPKLRSAAYEQRKRRSALVGRSHAGIELTRVSCLEFTQEVLQYGLFQDLEGTPCSLKGCKFRGWQKDRKLGKLNHRSYTTAILSLRGPQILR